MRTTTRDKLRGEAELSEDADLIVNRTAHFISDWIEEHVVDEPIPMSGIDAAEELANQCVADAQDEGIAAQDIQDEVGDLTEYIAETIDEGNGSPLEGVATAATKIAEPRLSSVNPRRWR
ncbi:DUF768 domain-containing protein [Mesorhizobium sp. B2-5-9]|uniref:DUF768 domain-containing protein n=1 Tax=unclassified Mesorhizobium TaxID=325217 RepID=UPI00112D7239|nr:MULTISPECIES: DUF768 domain-containing protein [unclassified Mesorhizobium]MBZ9696961.1 DUF768 domain-containing protein [Mesorhizobium sp. CO1-1-9]MBZ9977338.1 DUF768 domain-containing protein [Mesorhizobium sp. BR-1-1-10]TPK09048.1 DUF768 domain-containing protein [Mesorhizobium sp. B2-5-7]TPK12774.1 DUF768 domain-containing protein [Mesorhizobium sp. B2-5-9]TPK85864.1 DUF768 domain-containing protein [Mesorhizobium sp. B2-4-13]